MKTKNSSALTLSNGSKLAKPSDVEKKIGICVAEMRASQKLTQEELAQAVGLTKGNISKIENGHIVPPIGTLMKIAQALHADLTDFLKPADDNINDMVSVTRANEHQRMVRGGTVFGYDYVGLAPNKRSKHMEPFIFSFPSQVAKDVRFEHEGEEFLLILSGRVEWEMTINGQVQSWLLEAGDSIYFNSEIPHRGRAIGLNAKALIVVYASSTDSPPD